MWCLRDSLQLLWTSVYQKLSLGYRSYVFIGSKCLDPPEAVREVHPYKVLLGVRGDAVLLRSLLKLVVLVCTQVCSLFTGTLPLPLG